MSNTNSILKRLLRWLIIGSSTYWRVRLRRRFPRRLESIFDLKLV